jgi:hypothetical protein
MIPRSVSLVYYEMYYKRLVRKAVFLAGLANLPLKTECPDLNTFCFPAAL